MNKKPAVAGSLFLKNSYAPDHLAMDVEEQ